MKIEYNKNYTFTVNATFGDLPPSVVGELLKDGRVASHFLERQLEVWFPELTCVDQKGYDHIREGSDILYDQKSFTKGGLQFAPSSMYGAKRSVDYDVAHAHANSIDYIATDITEFPKVVVRFVKGSDLVKDHPSCKVSYAKKDQLFA